MRKIVPVHRKKHIISKNILEIKDIMREKRKTLSERRNGSFSGGSSLKTKFRKFALYAGDQAILLKIARKGKRQQTLIVKCIPVDGCLVAILPSSLGSYSLFYLERRITERSYTGPSNACPDALEW